MLKSFTFGLSFVGSRGCTRTVGVDGAGTRLWSVFLPLANFTFLLPWQVQAITGEWQLLDILPLSLESEKWQYSIPRIGSCGRCWSLSEPFLEQQVSRLAYAWVTETLMAPSKLDMWQLHSVWRFLSCLQLLLRSCPVLLVESSPTTRIFWTCGRNAGTLS